MRFWTGGYTADMEGTADGVGVLYAGAPDDVLAGGDLAFAGTAAAASSPSWLARHPLLDVVYAAEEGTGSVRAFARTGPESLTPLGAAVPAGDLVCHVAVAPDGAMLVASCYGDGRVVTVPLDATGTPDARRAADGAAAFDPYADLGMPVGAAGGRSSRAHQARFVPGGFVSTDLGFDTVRIWGRPSPAATSAGSGTAPLLRQTVVLPRGSGPRHGVWHPSGHLYVVTEHSAEVFVLRPGSDGSWMLIGGAPLLGAQPGADAPAEIALSRDARFVHIGVRGSDTIATLRVTGEGDALQFVALVESGVAGPRHHVVERDTLLVAGQRSNEVASLALDERTGVPGRARRWAEVPSPTCLLFDRPR